MINVLENLEEVEALRRVRIFFISCFLCSMIFYVLMTSLSPAYVDFLAGRIALSLFALFSFIGTFLLKDGLKFGRIALRICTFAFLLLYLYLLHLNHWSVFHCWSYFVVAAIICSTSMSWNAYLQHATLGIGGPLILSLWSPMNWLELLHFHAANTATFSIIGVAVHSTFKSKKEVERLTKNLIEQSKMAALGEMAGGISHEINNPLAVIKGAIEHLKRVPPEAPEDQEKFNNLTDKISRMVLRITKITNGLKEFSQDNTDQETGLHDLNEIIEDGITLSMRKFKDIAVDIIYHPTEEKALCLCRKNQIIQVIMNLCTNAIEATMKMPAPHIQATLKQDKDFYIISISDNGVGIPDDNVSKIMEPFFTTKEIGTGLGLGLSASHGFAKVNGGELSVERTKEMTTFHLKLPQLLNSTPA